MYLENYTLKKTSNILLNVRTCRKTSENTNQFNFINDEKETRRTKTKPKTGGHELRALKQRLSKKERRVDALALRADERRDKLRKASGRSKYPSIRRYLNGETHLSKPQVSIRQSITYGREPGELKHLSSRRKRKKVRFP